MCRSNSLVEKTCLYFEAVFYFYGGIEILLFCRRSRIHGHKFTPVLFQEWYEYFLVQTECSGCWKIISSYFWCSNSSFVLLLWSQRKQNCNELCIQLQYDQVTPFLGVKTQCDILWVASSWSGCSEVGDYEIYQK